MSFCTRCGAQADGNAAFCTRCGVALGGPAGRPPFAERRDLGAAASLRIAAKPVVDMGPLNCADVNSIQVEIDGRATEMAWGERRFDLPPGTHQVRVAIKNPIFGGGRAAAEARVNLNPGETLRLVYRGPLTIFQSGKLERIDGPMPAAAAAPVVAAAAAPACPNCRSPLGAGRFCTVCGFRLQS